MTVHRVTSSIVRPYTAEHTVREPASPEHAGAGVLVVEHDAHRRAALERALCERGYAVLTAADAPAALHLLEHLPVDEQPAAILLNLQLPIMTGQQFVYEYHQLPLPHAPILTLGPPLSATPTAAVAHGGAVAPTGEAMTTVGAGGWVEEDTDARAGEGGTVAPEQLEALLDSLHQLDAADH